MLIWRFAVIEYSPPESKWLWFSQLPGSLDSFVAGMLAAHCFSLYEVAEEKVRKRIQSWASPLLVVGALSLLGLIYWLDAIFWTYRTQHVVSYLWTVGLSIAYAIVIFYAAAGHSGLNRCLGNGWLVHIGLASYGIYLWHWPIALWLSQTSYYADAESYALIDYWIAMASLSLIIGWISWRWLEQPIIEAVGELLHRRPG